MVREGYVDLDFQKKIVKFLTLVGSISLFSIFLLMFFTIVLRCVFSFGFSWMNELILFFQMNLTFFTLPILFIKDEHLKVDFFVNKFPLLIRKITNRLIVLVSLAFGLIFIYSHYIYLKLAWAIATPVLGIPNAIYYLGSLIGMIFLVVFAIKKLFLKSMEEV